MKDGFYELNGECQGQQLIMFPYLGGNGMSLMNLAKEFVNKGLNVWVAYPPGHLGSDGSLCGSFEELMDFYMNHLKVILKKGSIFFGHSMGGVIAYLLAKKIENYYPELKPKAMILSATPAPDFMKNKSLSTSQDDMLISEMYRIGGMPEEIMDNKEILNYFLPIFRSDYKILEEIAGIKPEKLDIPTEFIFCNMDEMSGYETLLKWKNYITSKCLMCSMPKDAGHMFLNKYEDLVVGHVMKFVNIIKEY